MKLRTLINKAKNFPKKVLVASAILAAATLPLAGFATAENQVVMEGKTESLNVTKGETQYKDVTNAMVDEVVQVQLWQHNREVPETTFANNNRVKFSVPTAQGKSQVITGTSSADNANTITDTTTVNLSMDRARLEIVPDSAMFRYNKGAQDGRAECLTGLEFPPESCYATVAISTQDVTDADGINLDAVRGGPLKGCNAYHETVTIQVRVRADVVSVNKFVRHAGQGPSAWALTANAKPGDDLEYKINFKNEGNTQLNDVMVGDNIPKYNAYQAGTTKLYNGLNPDGMAVTTDNIDKGGINTGNYLPGAEAYVIIRVKIDPVSAFPKCGQYDVRNVGVVRPAGMNEFFNTAQVLINVECKEKPPTYVCDSLKAEVSADRTAKFTAAASATNGATISRYIYNFGDGSQQLTTDKNVVEHKYAKDGQYVATLTVEFKVNNETKTATGEQCKVNLSFKQGVPPTTTTKPLTPGKLPEAGAGDVIAVFVAVTATSSFGYFFAVRRSFTL